MGSNNTKAQKAFWKYTLSSTQNIQYDKLETDQFLWTLKKPNFNLYICFIPGASLKSLDLQISSQI